MITLYGLKSCDSCRAARRRLDGAGIAHDFVDVRATPLDAAHLARWAEALGWEVLVNRRSTTWRGLNEADRQIADQASAVALLQAHPTLIKRPVIETGKQIFSGLDDATLATLGG